MLVMTVSIDALITLADSGDRSAAATLFDTLYKELHRLARNELARHRARDGFGATTLLHEAYLAVCDRSGVAFPDRARFMAYASRVMRGLIIDEMRRRTAQKRGGGAQHTAFRSGATPPIEDPKWLERVSDALEELATHQPMMAEIVDLKFFGGFTCAEIAAMFGMSERTVKRKWERSRLYLHRVLGELDPMR
jgi:RNA polymerase sigma factor (TIGR02999 family)